MATKKQGKKRGPGRSRDKAADRKHRRGNLKGSNPKETQKKETKKRVRAHHGKRQRTSSVYSDHIQKKHNVPLRSTWTGIQGAESKQRTSSVYDPLFFLASISFLIIFFANTCTTSNKQISFHWRHSDRCIYVSLRKLTPKPQEHIADL